MALLAESLVDEWLNRQGFFTIRGVKQGIEEIDLLAIKPNKGEIIGWHVEVQVSFRPVGYISKIPKNIAASTGRTRTSAKLRTPQEIESFAKAWVQEKFLAESKALVRDSLWPGTQWKFHLVHAVVKDKRELNAIQNSGVMLLPFDELLNSLCQSYDGGFSASSGGDLAEVVRYYTELQSKRISPAAPADSARAPS